MWRPLCACQRAERSEEHTSELQSHLNLVCRLLLGKKKHTSELQSHLNIVCRLLLGKKQNIFNYPITKLRNYRISQIHTAISSKLRGLLVRSSNLRIYETTPRLIRY